MQHRLKTFRFLNFLLKYETFQDVVIENWKADSSGNPFHMFNHKLKKLNRALSVWIKIMYGNTFQKVASLEELAIANKTQFELNPTPHNRECLLKVQDEFIRYLTLEEEF